MSSEAQSLVSLAVSCLAFLVSGLALGWTIYRDVLDKGRLKIYLMVGRLIPGVQGAQPAFLASRLFAKMVAIGEAADDGRRDVIVVTITNVGKRPIVAMRLIGRPTRWQMGKQLFVVGARQIPRRLEAGDFITESFEDPAILDDAAKAIYIYDSTQRRWKARWRNLRRAKADAKKYLKQLRKGHGPGDQGGRR